LPFLALIQGKNSNLVSGNGLILELIFYYYLKKF